MFVEDQNEANIRTSTAALLAAYVPDTDNLAAVLAFSGRRATTARLELGSRVNAFKVTSRAGEAGDGAGGHDIRARKDRAAGLLNSALVSTATGLRVARRARRGGRSGGSSTALAARGLALVPGPVATTLGGRTRGPLRLARKTVSFVLGPVPAVRGALVHALRGSGRVGYTAVGGTTVLDAVAGPVSENPAHDVW